MSLIDGPTITIYNYITPTKLTIYFILKIVSSTIVKKKLNGPRVQN
jgi:hypothetical protein